MADADLKKKVVKGFAWALLERFSTQFAGFFVTMILARLLTPADYGTVALLTIFIAISSVLADSGFGQALIQKKDATEADFNSVFYLSLALSSAVYGVLFLCAPLIAGFYGDPRLAAILRVLAVTLVLNAVNSVQNAELNRKLLFHLSFRISIINSVATAAVGVSLAYRGYGPWALVWSTVTGAAVGVATRWVFIAWRPRWMFSWRSVRGLFRFGWKMTVSALMDSGYNNLYGLLIGKLYSKSDLAFVNKGRSTPSLAMEAVNGTLGRVAFPALAQIQDRRDAVRETMRRMIVCSTFFVFPMMTGVAVCAGRLVPLLFGDQWGQAVPFVRLYCFTFALWPFHTINLQAITALGRSDVFLKLEVVKKAIGLILLACTFRLGVWWMVAVGAVVGGPLSVVVNAWPNRGLLGYTVAMQVRDVLPTAAVCACMAAAVAPLGGLPLPGWGILLIQVPAGAFLFLFLSWLFRLRPMREYARIGGPVLAARAPRPVRPLAARLLARLGA